MEVRQQFYRSGISGNSVQLSPQTTSNCTRDIALPPQLALLKITITTASGTPDTEFFPSGGCARYEAVIRKVN